MNMGVYILVHKLYLYFVYNIKPNIFLLTELGFYLWCQR